MTIKSFPIRPFLYTAALSGIVLGLLLTFIPLPATNILPSLSDIALVFIMHLIAIIAVGYIAGSILKHRINNPYLVSITVMFYLYDISTFLRYLYFGYIICSLLLGLVSVGLFFFANKLFKRYSSHKKWLVVFATVGFIAFYTICVSLGLFLMRSIAAATIH